MAGLLLAPLQVAAGQSTLGDMRRQASRAELEVMIAASENAASAAPDQKTRTRHLANAAAVQQRLRNGDFNPGDRILLQVLGDTVFSDTFTVRADRKVQVPGLPEIPLHGVLDSELPQHMTTTLSKYLRNIEVTTTVLVRIAVLGAVGRPAFYTVPVDQAITDVITGAGGLTPASELEKIVVRRGGREIIDPRGMQDALAQGKTVGDLSIRDGDQIFLPASQVGVSRWQQFIGVAGALGGLFWIVRYGFGRGRG